MYALVKFALARIASTRIAPLSFAPIRFALDNSHPLHSLVSISLFKCAGSKADALVAASVATTVIVANNRFMAHPYSSYDITFVTTLGKHGFR